MKKVQDIIVNKPYLAWYVKTKENLSDESVLEHVLNYGDFDDIKEFIKIKGIKETAKLFKKGLNKKRSNYLKPIANYFNLYFNKYA